MRMKFWVKIFVIIALLLTGGWFFLRYESSSSFTGELNSSDLAGKVYIYRDKHGIPHIYAKENDNDVFFALGFVHAQDRFWQMEFQRRVVSGTLSEIFGNKTVLMDKYLRTFGFYHAAELAWQSLDQETQNKVKQYTAGVNAFIKQNHF